MTNDARHGEDDFVRKLWRLGFQAAREEIVTAGGALQHVLAESGHATAFVIGSTAVHRHVTDAGLRILNGSDLADRADVVVVSGHERFDFAELRGAVQAVLRGAEVWCTSRDATFPMPDGPWPATGSVVAAVEYATGRRRALGRQARAPALPHRARPPGRRPRAGRSAIASTPTWPARAPPGIDGAIVLTGATHGRRWPARPTPRPPSSPPRLAELLLAP